jgi:hypothetical protein
MNVLQKCKNPDCRRFGASLVQKQISTFSVQVRPQTEVPPIIERRTTTIGAGSLIDLWRAETLAASRVQGLTNSTNTAMTITSTAGA